MNNIDILEELKPEKMDLIQLIRTFKREGIENFITIRREKFETLIAENKELKETVEKRNNKIYELLDRSINALKLINKEEVKQDYIPKSKVEAKIEDDNWVISKKKINYCPMCGRDLRRNNTDEH